MQRAHAKKMGRVWTSFREITITDKMRAETPLLAHCHGIWSNSRFQVDCYKVNSGIGGIMQCAIRGHADIWPITWDDLQRIKNEVFGPTAIAVELYPATDNEWRPMVNARIIYVVPSNWACPFGLQLAGAWGRNDG